MEDEELLAHKKSGGLTPDAAKWIDEEITKRNFSPEQYEKVIRNIQRMTGLPEELSDSTLAAIWSRLFAHLIDHLVAVICGAIGFLIISEWAGLIAYFAYYLFSDALPNGMSFGKRMFAIKVIGIETFNPCSPGQSFKRNLYTLVPILNLFDVIAMRGPLNQRLGDDWAKTIVIES